MSTRDVNDERLIRLENFKRVCAERGLDAPQLRELFETKSPAFWGNFLAGKKSFGEKIARKIEAKLDLPSKWLDTASDPDIPPQKREPYNDELSPSEWAHLTEYREASKHDRAEIDALTAKSAEKMRVLRREVMERMGLPGEAKPEAGNSLPRAPERLKAGGISSLKGRSHPTPKGHVPTNKPKVR